MKRSVSNLQAIGFALVGFTFWVFADSSIKLAGESALPTYEVLAFLGLFVVLFMVVYGFWRGEAKTLWPKQPKRQIFRACLDLGNNFFIVIALRHLPLTLFYILVFTAPIFIAIMAAIFLRERLEWRKAFAILAGFAGVVIAVNPFGTETQGDWIGYAACAMSVICFAANMVWSRHMTQAETAESLTFFSGLVMAVAGFGLMARHAELLTLRLLAVLFAMGAFCALGNICNFIALKYTSATTVSQYHYTQLISGALIGYLVWHEKPTLFMFIGSGIIIAAGLYVAQRARNETTL